MEEIHSLWDSRWLTNMGENHNLLEQKVQEFLGAYVRMDYENFVYRDFDPAADASILSYLELLPLGKGEAAEEARVLDFGRGTELYKYELGGVTRVLKQYRIRPPD